MAEDEKVAVSKETLGRLLENQKKLIEKVEKEREKREKAEDRKRWWAGVRLKAAQLTRKITGHWGAMAVVGGTVVAGGIAALGSPYFLPGYLVALGLLGKATAAVGVASVGRTLLSDALEDQEKKDAKLLPAKTEVEEVEIEEKEEEIDFVFEDEILG